MYISEWLVLGPISDRTFSHPSVPDEEWPKIESTLNKIDISSLVKKNITQSLNNSPKDGDIFHYSDQIFGTDHYQWRPFHFSTNWQDILTIKNNINTLSPEFTEKYHAIAFFLVYIRSSEEEKETEFCIKNNNPIKLWLNGEAFGYISERNISDPETCSTVALKKGYNILMLATEKIYPEWGLSVRVADNEQLTFTTGKPELLITCPQEKLGDISSCYSIFEKDQILTYAQLNSITQYFDEQIRLTRVNTIGVGIVCGLQVQVHPDFSFIKITKGIGITTEGDLLHVSSDIILDKFRLYDTLNSLYQPFYNDGEMITIYELVRHEVTDTNCFPLKQFDTQTEDHLSGMVAVLFMESYVNDLDLCTNTHCNNLGKNQVHTIRILLIKEENISLLKPSITVDHFFYEELHAILADRPLIQSSTNFDGIYRQSCNAIHTKLIVQFPKFIEIANKLLFADQKESALSPELEQILNNLNAKFNTESCCIQYYYDFLKDCVETYNRFLELVFNDMTECCLEPHHFPKHLLLGNLSNTNENRSYFYPSPAVSPKTEQRSHAQFLAEKLNTLIRTFEIPTPSTTSIKITPSLFEDHPLEERTIPYYYREKIRENWKYRSYPPIRETDLTNDSLVQFQIGRFSFFRIEGHLGKNVLTVLENIKEQITSKNLPFAVCTVMLGTDTNKLVKLPKIRYSYLHRIHYLLRQTIYKQLDEVIHFSNHFKDKIEYFIDKKVILDTDSRNGSSIKTTVSVADSTVTTRAKSLQMKLLNRNYLQHKVDDSWQADLKSVLETTSRLKRDLGKVTKTDFATPFDILASNTHIQWLGWIDDLIAKEEQKDKNKLLFSEFISQHPGIEHFAGVTRGGTFVLVYDNENNIVADFMLPYYCHDVLEEEVQETTDLPTLNLKPSWMLEKGIYIQPSLDHFMLDELKHFKLNELENQFIRATQFEDKITQFEVNIQTQLETQKETYFNAAMDYLKFPLIKETMANSKPYVAGEVLLSDKKLNETVGKIKENQTAIDYLRIKSKNPDLSDERRGMYNELINEAEGELATTIEDSVGHISSLDQNALTGSESSIAMLHILSSFGKLEDSSIVNKVTETLKTLRDKTSNPELKSMLNVIVRK